MRESDRLSKVRASGSFVLSTVLIGPYRKLVAGNITELEASHSVAPLFDVMGAHNIGGDTTATPET